MRVGGAARWAVGLAALTALAGCSDGGGSMAAKPAAVSSHPATSVADGFKSSRGTAAVALPTRVRVPRVGISSALERLGTAADGTIQLPSRPEHAGWYTGGARPGQKGPAVIIGHVDWDHGPAVFYRLSELRPGDEIDVDRADGSTGRFTVERLQQVPKTAFPTDLVYAPSLTTTLRLVTCGGSFDHSAHSYRDNVIVYAVPR